jgi:hypothetical protein
MMPASPAAQAVRACRFRKVLWGSPNADGKEGRPRGRERHRPTRSGLDPRDDSNFADTTSDLRAFARTGRIEVDNDAFATLLAQPDFSSSRFIQSHMTQLNNAGLEHARGELERFMTHVQNQVRTPCIATCSATCPHAVQATERAFRPITLVACRHSVMKEKVSTCNPLLVGLRVHRPCARHHESDKIQARCRGCRCSTTRSTTTRST